jgi:membrane protein implicated in regulation of membrane protease activity
VRQDRSKIVLTIPELLVVLGLLAYAVGALAFALFGPMFFAWLLAIAVVVSPFSAFAARCRRRRLARIRASRRRARVTAYRELWEEAA